MVFPLTPGNVGTHQLVSVLVLGLFGVAEADALAFSIGMQAAAIVLMVGVGSAFLLREGLSVVDSFRLWRASKSATVEALPEPSGPAVDRR